MKHFSFANGLELIVHQDTSLNNSFLNILYKVGSANEEPTQTGVAHFLEHMMFEGSKSYPNFDVLLQNIMAENNAFTGQDYTCYYITCPKKHLKEILNIEKDRMLALQMKRAAVDNQSRVIIEEFKETTLNPPLADVWHYLQKLCFKNSYSWPVIGKSIEHIERIHKPVLSKFYKMYYTPKNAILSIVSSASEIEIAELIRVVFNTSLREETNSNHFISFENKYKQRGKKTLNRKNITTPTFYMAFHIDDLASKDYFMSDMVSDLLTNGESSLLYKSLVLESKLCTEIQSYTTDNLHCNLLIIEGKLSSGVRFDSVYERMEQVFTKARSVRLQMRVFESLKNKAITYWSFLHYNPSQLVQNMGIFFAAGAIVSPVEYIKNQYQTISKKDVELHLQELLKLENASILEYMPK